MITLARKRFKGCVIITDPMYIVKSDKLVDDASKPDRSKFYPQDWTPPTEEDYFNNTPKALEAKHYENCYETALSEWKESLPSDWDCCNYGDNMENLGITSCMIADTVYGAWSCTVFNPKEEVLGRFTSDSGLVGVFLLDEILGYNPKWDNHLTKPYSATCIPDFDGIISIVNVGGTSAGDCDVRILGKGNVLFQSKQTGF